MLRKRRAVIYSACLRLLMLNHGHQMISSAISLSIKSWWYFHYLPNSAQGFKSRSEDGGSFWPPTVPPAPQRNLLLVPTQEKSWKQDLQILVNLRGKEQGLLASSRLERGIAAWKESSSEGSHAVTWPLSLLGCGGGRRGKLHHPVLYPAGPRGLPHPDRNSKHLCLGGTVNHQGSSQTSQTGHLWTAVLLFAGVQHPGLLPRWHAGCS